MRGRLSKWPSLASVGMPPFGDDPRRACKDTPTELFFVDVKGRGAAEREAKRICRRCPLLAECRAWARPVRDLGGIWGATTALERDKWRKNRGK